ncbi:hypothetical protein [Maridesulfovibrio ferrireducens]|uniref:hypothetical protein n=1 Tax=Maridesulfovibrio ferrireducens TaxID=246191 RepID=UPI001A2E4BE2|nr:hypothetical protein [Maridesulfovibrio ferrireducens]MBI9110252.1 hypothetical protein [Maridesulfovibrio ferrireducens]
MIRKIFSKNGYKFFSILFFGISIVSCWRGENEKAVINMLFAIYFELSELNARD